MIMNINNSNEQMTINTLQQLSQLTSTKISISIYSYKTCDVQQQKSYKCYKLLAITIFQKLICLLHFVS